MAVNRGRRLALKLIASMAVVGVGYYVISRLIPVRLNLSKVSSGSSSTLSPMLRQVSSMELMDSLKGFSISANGGVVLSEKSFIMQILPGTSGDYALLFNNGNVYILLPSNYGNVGPNPTLPSNIDLSNVTGTTRISEFTVFGGGVVCYGEDSIPPPWSPCACPCSPYVGIYNNSTDELNVMAIPGGSCDNANFTFAVNGNNNDLLLFGGGNYPPRSCECGTWCVTHRSSVTSVGIGGEPMAMGFTTIDVEDDDGNELWMYRMPGVRYGSGVLLLAQGANSSRLLLENINLSELYSNMNSKPTTLCTGEPYVKPNLQSVLADDFNGDAIPFTWINDDQVYVAYHSIDGYVNVVSNGGFRLSLTKVPSTPFIKFVDGELYVAYNNDGEFTIKALNPYGGNLLGEVTVNGQGFIDVNGYAVVLEGLTPGSLIRVFKLGTDNEVSLVL